MLSVDEALEQILKSVVPFEPETVPTAEALGLAVAEDVVSDTDSPPFDKALMDGYAVRSADVSGETVLSVVEEITAGRVATRPVQAGEAARIMTGAPMPAGADAVVRIEDTRFDTTTGAVTIQTSTVTAGTNMMLRGTSMRRGDVVLTAGRELRAQELGALAEMGVAAVPVRRRPRVAILATGDELVSVGERPGPGQIRNSNETMLIAQVRRAGGEPAPLGIARDNRPELAAKIRDGLRCDVLLLSGGVSAGKLDLVPSELDAAGVKQVFHKVNVKPGKPLWFGSCETRNRADCGLCFVFGLPGNPVSSMVCFELFARTAIRRLMGLRNPRPEHVSAQLSHDFTFRGDRHTFHPCQLEWTQTGLFARIGPWHGSADLRSTVDTQGLAVFPPGETEFRAGDRIDVMPW
jgi:molybdopterin molybdotransferase